MNKRFWKEKYFGNYCFYFGRLSRKDYRLGVSIGDENTTVDIFNFTFGFMKL